MSPHRSPFVDLWSLRPGVTYLNHGSFGPAPKTVLAARQDWTERLEAEPMDFFVRQLEGHLEQARDRLGRFVGTKGEQLVFVDNATFGMNIIANSFPLAAGDEVLATDHEYGAVLRIWRKACQKAGANLVVQRLPVRFTSADEVVETLFAGATPRTKLLVVSHVTSPTAVILPVERICRRAREGGIPVCIDGPHAPAAVPVEIDRLGCDFYTASCHKWLSAPMGSGFLYVHPRRRAALEPVIVSWGNSLSGRPSSWVDEFTWLGTRDPAAFLSVPAAIDFFDGLQDPSSATHSGIAVFRRHGHDLAQYARNEITRWTGLEPLVPDSTDWYGPMIALPLPESVPEPVQPHMHQLQTTLWERHRIEVPIVNFRGRRYVRVSAHLYNSTADIDLLVGALRAVIS